MINNLNKWVKKIKKYKKNVQLLDNKILLLCLELYQYYY